jgi:hypothetical protein
MYLRVPFRARARGCRHTDAAPAPRSGAARAELAGAVDLAGALEASVGHLVAVDEAGAPRLRGDRPRVRLHAQRIRVAAAVVGALRAYDVVGLRSAARRRRRRRGGGARQLRARLRAARRSAQMHHKHHKSGGLARQDARAASHHEGGAGGKEQSRREASHRDGCKRAARNDQAGGAGHPGEANNNKGARPRKHPRACASSARRRITAVRSRARCAATSTRRPQLMRRAGGGGCAARGRQLCHATTQDVAAARPDSWHWRVPPRISMVSTCRWCCRCRRRSRARR